MFLVLVFARKVGELEELYRARTISESVDSCTFAIGERRNGGPGLGEPPPENLYGAMRACSTTPKGRYSGGTGKFRKVKSDQPI
jgi:hypothetical protein